MSVWAAYSGPSHVILDCNEAQRAIVGFDPRGIPAREAFALPGMSIVQQRMDTVYATGVPAWLWVSARDGTPGLLVIVPLRDEDGVWGVTTLWKAVTPSAALRPSVRGRRPALRESA